MKKAIASYDVPTRTRRRGRPRPFNHRKNPGPRSAFRGLRKKKRGQG